MGFEGDERGVTVQIGAVLLFGFLIIGLSIYQVTVVPAQNQEIEFNHNQEVQNDMVDLRSAMLDTAADGNPESVVVQLGARYPSRALFVNPAPPSGTVRSDGTDDPAVNVSIANANGSVVAGGDAEDVGDFWNGTTRTFATGVVVYKPDYNRYLPAPVTVYENTLVHNMQSDATVPTTGEALLDGTEITVVTVDGNLSRNGVASRTIDVEAASASTNVVRLRNETSNVTVTVPTRLSESAWRDLLAEEFEDGHLLGIEYADGPGEYSLLTLQLEPNTTYRLRMAKVNVGTGGSDPGPAYLVKQRGDGATVPEGTGQKLEVEVRDRYGNPVEEGTVNVSLSGVGNVSAQGQFGTSLTNLDVGADGVVELDYEAPADVHGTENATVNVSLDGAGTVAAADARDTQFDLQVADTDGSGGGANINQGEIKVTDETITDKDTVNLTLNNSLGTDVNITEAKLNFYFSNSDNDYEEVDISNASISGGKTTLVVGGGLENLDPEIQVTGNETTTEVELVFKQTDPEGNLDVSPDHFFVLTLTYSNGETNTYFVSP